MNKVEEEKPLKNLYIKQCGSQSTEHESNYSGKSIKPIVENNTSRVTCSAKKSI